MQSEWRVKLDPVFLADLPSPATRWLCVTPYDRNLDLRETIYFEVLDGKDPVVNFMRGTALRPFLSALPENEAAKFIDSFAERMAAAYPAQPNGQTLFPFRRFFLVAQK